MRGSPSKPEPATASIDKALTLFRRIAEDRGNMSLKDIAVDLQLSRSTLYRLAGTLQDHGLISRGAHGTYDIGLPLMEALNGVTATKQLARLSRSILCRLASDCGATAHLGVLENDMVTYLVKETARKTQPAAAFAQENSQLEAYCSAIGKVLLAWLPASERNRYLAGGPFVAMTSRTITDPLALSKTLKTIKEQEFALDDREIADDVYCIAVPIWTRAAPMTAAISLSFPQRFFKAEHDATYLVKLQNCALKLRARLGRKTS